MTRLGPIFLEPVHWLPCCHVFMNCIDYSRSSPPYLTPSFLSSVSTSRLSPSVSPRLFACLFLRLATGLSSRLPCISSFLAPRVSPASLCSTCLFPSAIYHYLHTFFLDIPLNPLCVAVISSPSVPDCLQFILLRKLGTKNCVLCPSYQSK